MKIDFNQTEYDFLYSKLDGKSAQRIVRDAVKEYMKQNQHRAKGANNERPKPERK